MFSEKDFERLWFFYKTEGEPKGVSINSFCISNNISYTAFYDWFKKTQKKVVPVEVEGIPEELLQGLLLQAAQRTKKGKNGLRKPSSHDNMQIIIVKFVDSFLTGACWRPSKRGHPKIGSLLTSGAILFLRNTTVLDLSLLLNKMIG